MKNIRLNSSVGSEDYFTPTNSSLFKPVGEVLSLAHRPRMGPLLFGRTEDYPYYPMVASTTRTMWWLMRRII